MLGENEALAPDRWPGLRRALHALARLSFGVLITEDHARYLMSYVTESARACSFSSSEQVQKTVLAVLAGQSLLGKFNCASVFNVF